MGLSNIGTLPRWIKEYTENGHTVVEKKRGRKSHGKEDRQSAGGKQSTEGRKCEATQAERDSYDTTRITTPATTTTETGDAPVPSSSSVIIGGLYPSIF